MSPAVIIAVCITVIAISSLTIFVAAAMNTASLADDADEALIARLTDGDTRLAEVMNPQVHNGCNNR